VDCGRILAHYHLKVAAQRPRSAWLGGQAVYTAAAARLEVAALGYLLPKDTCRLADGRWPARVRGSPDPFDAGAAKGDDIVHISTPGIRFSKIDPSPIDVYTSPGASRQRLEVKMVRFDPRHTPVYPDACACLRMAVQ